MKLIEVGSTAGKWLVIAAVIALLLKAMETLKNLWLNWGAPYPFSSSVVVAVIAICAWWLFGLLISLSQPPKTTQKESSTSQPTPLQTSTPVPTSSRPESVPSTGIPYAKLEALFPFGYVVFLMGKGKHTYEPEPSEKLRWIADWSKVEIIPDFSKRTVRWNIPSLSSTTTAHHLQVLRQQTGGMYPLDTKRIFAIKSMYVENEPLIWVGTLSDDQRFPIFVLGFRILEGPDDIVRQR